MKCAIVIADGVKQVMFTPETENEKVALKMINADDEITVEAKSGVFYEGFNEPTKLRGYNVALCQGGYLRAYENADSLMFVLKPKVTPNTEDK